MHGYSEDQSVIRWFPGTGIAGKIDVASAIPAYLDIEALSSPTSVRTPVAADGTFVAALVPGDYRLQLPGESRWTLVFVPRGHCLDLVLDFRLPGVVLQIPGEGLPVPAAV
jgi:hypothetical protein